MTVLTVVLAGMMKTAISCPYVDQNPFTGARLSSSFGSRRHPVSGLTPCIKGSILPRPRHPIIAAGSGVVREARWKGSFGRYIRIKHNATYDTAYAHMGRIAPHITAGSRVKGEIIDMWAQPAGLLAPICIMKSF